MLLGINWVYNASLNRVTCGSDLATSSQLKNYNLYESRKIWLITEISQDIVIIKSS